MYKNSIFRVNKIDYVRKFIKTIKIKHNKKYIIQNILANSIKSIINIYKLLPNFKALQLWLMSK